MSKGKLYARHVARVFPFGAASWHWRYIDGVEDTWWTLPNGDELRIHLIPPDRPFDDTLRNEEWFTWIHSWTGEI